MHFVRYLVAKDEQLHRLLSVAEGAEYLENDVAMNTSVKLLRSTLAKMCLNKCNHKSALLITVTVSAVCTDFKVLSERKADQLNQVRVTQDLEHS